MVNWIRSIRAAVIAGAVVCIGAVTVERAGIDADAMRDSGQSSSGVAAG